MTQGRRLAVTALLFALAIAMIAVTVAIHAYGPLFVAWLPLVAAAMVLARRDPGYTPPPPARPARTAPVEAGSEPAADAEDPAAPTSAPDD